MTRVSRDSRTGNSASARGHAAADSYFYRSSLPLASLLFLLPLIVAYEIGIQYHDATLSAPELLRGFFHLFGATGKHLPALAVLSILLAWHIMRKDRWSFSPAMLGAMSLESIGLVLPVSLRTWSSWPPLRW